MQLSVLKYTYLIHGLYTSLFRYISFYASSGYKPSFSMSTEAPRGEDVKQKRSRDLHDRTFAIGSFLDQYESLLDDSAPTRPCFAMLPQMLPQHPYYVIPKSMVSSYVQGELGPRPRWHRCKLDPPGDPATLLCTQHTLLAPMAHEEDAQSHLFYVDTGNITYRHHDAAFGSAVTASAMAPDQRYFVLGSKNGEIRFMSDSEDFPVSHYNSPNAFKLPDVDGAAPRVVGLAVAPTGARVAVLTVYGVTIYDCGAPSNEQTFMFDEPDTKVSSICAHPYAPLLLITSETQSCGIRVLDLAQENPQYVVFDRREYNQAVWHANGRDFAAISHTRSEVAWFDVRLSSHKYNTTKLELPGKGTPVTCQPIGLAYSPAAPDLLSVLCTGHVLFLWHQPPAPNDNAVPAPPALLHWNEANKTRNNAAVNEPARISYRRHAWTPDGSMLFVLQEEVAERRQASDAPLNQFIVALDVAELAPDDEEYLEKKNNSKQNNRR